MPTEFYSFRGSLILIFHVLIILIFFSCQNKFPAPEQQLVLIYWAVISLGRLKEVLYQLIAYENLYFHISWEKKWNIFWLINQISLYEITSGNKMTQKLRVLFQRTEIQLPASMLGVLQLPALRSQTSFSDFHEMLTCIHFIHTK